MPLAPGVRLGPYEVSALIGAGGMGEVYRATDTNLKRQVALKVLPASLAGDAERLARFQREAEVLAALNHPHIAQIHGLEKSAGVTALVMELVEGEDLSQRIARGAIPLEEALPIAKQIADALEVAHEQGIVHRDLKPANIKVRADGTVKVLDFGLAKAMEPLGLSSMASQSPTVTSPVMMTGMGVILGTAAYMSPEQAVGRPVDKRSDVWAFGVVLLEMLTGRPVFAGETVSHVLAAVLKSAPDWTPLPADTPARIRTLLRRCLEKDRKRRLDSAADARLEIEDVLAGPAEDAGAIAPRMTAVPRWRRALPWAMAGALGLGLALVLLLWAPRRPLPAAAPIRVSAELGADASLVILPSSTPPLGNAAVISPDGTRLAFVAQPRSGGVTRLYVRRLDELNAAPLPGTENAAGPFFSPDGQWLGLFDGIKLKKIAVSGGAPVPLADALNARGGSWAEDGTIVFTPTAGFSGLWRVPAAGGAAAEVLTTVAPGETTHRWPQVLPGGRAVLYTVGAVQGNFSAAWLAVQPLPTGPSQVVHRGGSYGRYVPSGPGSPTRTEREGGHLTWVNNGTLFAAPFDLATLKVTGSAMPVVPGVMSSTTSGGAQVDVSHTGTLVYLPGGESAFAAPLIWLTSDGKAVPLRAQPFNWGGVQIATDGSRRLALTITDAKQDVWTYDAGTEAWTKLTTTPGASRNPVWTPNGQRLVYASSGGGGVGGALNLYWQRADRSDDATRLTTSPNQQFPASWDPSGHVLAFQETRPQTNGDVLTLRIDGDEASGWKIGTPKVFLEGPFTEQQPRFSPDGNWLAYASNESSRFEIYVQPFPGPGARSTISTGGGTNAVWSRTRRELLYVAPDGRIMKVAYTAAGDAFQPEKPRVWSETLIQVRPITGASFDLHPDGERVVMAPRAEEAAPTHVTLWFNFFDELRRLAPLK